MNRHTQYLNYWTIAIITGLLLAVTSEAALAVSIPSGAVKKSLPLFGLLGGVFQLLIGPATVIGSGLYAKDHDADVRKLALAVAVIGGMSCVYFWFGAGFSFFGAIGYLVFGYFGALGYFAIIHYSGSDNGNPNKPQGPPPLK